jgi:hypothetical protein
MTEIVPLGEKSDLNLSCLHSSRYIDHQTGPFGLPVAPQVFTRVFQTVMAHLHTLYLGFLISWKKSQILPSQDFFVLGEHYRTDLGLIFPPAPI